ncbi:MAG: hypothetical protein HUJ30_04700 [Gammaproteobacteria bacterium]|nr:hypothetical protein [Gammaproteobacteria bacterium]
MIKFYEAIASKFENYALHLKVISSLFLLALLTGGFTYFELWASFLLTLLMLWSGWLSLIVFLFSTVDTQDQPNMNQLRPDVWRNPAKVIFLTFYGFVLILFTIKFVSVVLK